MHMLPMFGDNDRLPSLHMDKLFIWLEETCERINEFDTGYMISVYWVLINTIQV